MIIIQEGQVTMDTATYHELNTDAQRFRFVMKAMLDDKSPQFRHMEDSPEGDDPGETGSPQDQMDHFLKVIDEGLAKHGVQ